MFTQMAESEFARIASIRRGQLAWFLGAGTSASAGVPTAGHMIAEFKASLYASSHKLSRSEIDADDPLWMERINRYFDNANGFPSTGDPREYEAAFRQMYPSATDRRRYIQSAIKSGRPSFGQRILGALIVIGFVPTVFTTNFDALVELATAAANNAIESGERRSLNVSALTNSDIALRCLVQNDWPLLVKLHGDYQSDAIKNTSEELCEQDTVLRQVLEESSRRFGFVVSGYSGRDDSVMEALEAGLSGPIPFPNGLFWIVRSTTKLLPRVKAFLEAAESAGVEVHLVVSETFDELLAEIARQVEFPPELGNFLGEMHRVDHLTDVQLPTTEIANFPVLRFNALPVLKMPRNVWRARASIQNRDLRSALWTRRSRAIAKSNGSELMALGSDVDLCEAIGDMLDASSLKLLVADPANDMVVRGIMLEALARGLTHRRPLRIHIRKHRVVLYLMDPAQARGERDRQQILSELIPFRSVYGSDLFGNLTKFDGRRYAEGVRLRLEYCLDAWWLVFEPTTWVQPAQDSAKPDPVVPWLRQRWFMRRNREWASMVDVWASVLAPHQQSTVRAWNDVEDMEFVLSKITAWCCPSQEGLT